MPKTCAVLTGDLIGSSRAGAAVTSAAFEALAQADRDIRAWPGEARAPSLERFRGDGWQALVIQPRLALRAACLYSAAVRSTGKSAATRLCAGLAPVKAIPKDGGLGAGEGEAFVLSGQGLESMPKALRMSARVSASARPDITGWAPAAFGLAGALCARWTPRQAQVMRHLVTLDPPTQAALGAQLGISQQTVQDHFESAEGPALLAVLDQMEGSA
ncbi:MAG: hypothetical protein LAT81_03465 [Oceanicaulis sp.]|nr:hypothetical protein [Oceanicaulis sp.]